MKLLQSKLFLIEILEMQKDIILEKKKNNNLIGKKPPNLVETKEEN